MIGASDKVAIHIDRTVTGGTLLSSENYLYDGSDRLIRVVETDGDNVVLHDFSWTYDAKDNVTALTESIGGKSFSYTYAYDDDSRPTTFGYGDVTKQITYDGHGRSSGTTVKNGSSTVLGTGYAYRDVDSTYTTTQVKSVTNSYGGKTANFNYTYDANGNILSVSGDQTATYEYDDLGQLITETIGTGDEQVIIRYTYDNGGNLIKKVREYNTEAPEPAPTSDNLLSDGGFEVASSWKAVYKNSVSASTQTTNGRSGSCWMLDYYAGDPAKVYTTVNVTPGESYTLSGYVVGSAKLYISAGDETVFSSAGGSSWQLCSVDITIPDGITTAQVGGYLDYDDPSRLDDLYFAISTPTSATGTSGTSNVETLYTYGDAEWGDLLTAYNGEEITYDGIGNPLSYRGWTMNWQGGRQLASMTKGSDTLSFVYNESGLRTSKTVNGVTHSYIWQGSKLAADITDAYALYFHYDSSGEVIGFTRTANGADTEYFYVKNLQGDILKVITVTGTEAATYTYDSWGRVLTSTGNLADINPLRYRGYYYDAETNLYYLQSRYYDPEVGRFISSDKVASTGQGILGANMFAYCLNNPMMFTDINGCEPKPWQWAISGAMVVGGIVLISTGVGGFWGGTLLCAGANSIIGSYTAENSGYSSDAGWTGGLVMGAACGFGAGYAGQAYMMATNSVGTACLSNLSLSIAASFGSGFGGAVAGQVVSNLVDGKKPFSNLQYTAAALTGVANTVAGCFSAVGEALRQMPAISTTTKALADAITAGWTYFSEGACDFLGNLSNVRIPW